MKAKHALILLITGFVLDYIGALLKIMHYPGGKELLIFGMLFKVIGLILFLYKLLKHPAFKDFMNS
ncbi:GldL-related protein [Fluviicola taffensis]|uniref:Gliding motility protein GldL-like N-terminal domain-containing protein n=1 Tax=Fluviicola taffensis (strain DSM 16823 / NCIMB 13979 / RW262) TaxID=755732 RepID=F2IA38_FLUTR|nr:hypothetical protein [Fluviicola taffensis]AEA45215.1 hypothetical protein Fluta_3242 [Fluviicola taffensis DSM 16823]